jgi:hypothetical protein
MFNSLEITEESAGVRSVRRILGIKVRDTTMRREDFVRFSSHSTSSSQSGNKHVVNYAVSAVARNGEKMVMGEGFKGAGQAEAAARLIGETFRLREKASERPQENPIDDYNLLAAD